MFNVNDMPDDVDPTKYYKKLQKWEEFKLSKWPVIKRNRIFKWIVLVYDKESPFAVKVTDIVQRKVEVARYANLIDRGIKEVSEDMKKILTNQDEDVNKAVVAYCRMHRSHKYSLVVALEEMYYADLLSARNNPDEFKGNLSKSQQELEKATLEFLNADDNPNLNDQLFAYMEDDRIENFRPEGIAELLSLNKDPFDGQHYPSN